jgi:hypothetical protein
VSADAPARMAWCLSCGRPAYSAMPSIDARHPLVRCVRTNDDDKERGCGTVPGTYDRAEAEAADLRRRQQRATKRHPEHIASGRRSANCLTCDTDPPPDRATIHRYAEITDRLHLASHLELSHADRRMRTNLYRRDLRADLAAHRELHDAALARPDVAVGAAVVLDGVKYRVRQITELGLELAAASPAWRRAPIVRSLPSRTRLEYDAAAGAWRLGPLGAG